MGVFFIIFYFKACMEYWLWLSSLFEGLFWQIATATRFTIIYWSKGAKLLTYFFRLFLWNLIEKLFDVTSPWQKERLIFQTILLTFWGKKTRNLHVSARFSESFFFWTILNYFEYKNNLWSPMWEKKYCRRPAYLFLLLKLFVVNKVKPVLSIQKIHFYWQWIGMAIKTCRVRYIFPVNPTGFASLEVNEIPAVFILLTWFVFDKSVYGNWHR